MSEFVTLNQAVEETGKSTSTIKRLLREVTQTKDHPSRHQILPTPKDVASFKAARRPFKWTISKELLNERFAVGQDKNKERSMTGSTERATASVIEVLREQLATKDQQMQALERQLDRKDEQIHDLSSQAKANSHLMHETHQLMAHLQTRFAIGEQKKAGWFKKLLGKAKQVPSATE